MKATRTCHSWVHMFISHQPTLTLQRHNFNLFRTCRTSSFCTVAWQLARFQLTRRIAWSLGNSWPCNLPHLYSVPLLGVTQVAFCWDLWHQKTSPWAIVQHCLRDLHVAILVELWLVTDRQTRGHGIYHASIVSLCKNVQLLLAHLVCVVCDCRTLWNLQRDNICWLLFTLLHCKQCTYDN